MTTLTHKQRSKFQEQGYLIVNEMFHNNEIARIKSQLQLISAIYPDAVLAEKSKTESSKTIPFQISHPGNYSSYLHHLTSENSNIRRAASFLLGAPVSLLADVYNIKSRGGGNFDAHQDMQAPVIRYLNSEFPDNKPIKTLVTACVALTHHSRENGFVEIAAGQHKTGLLGPEGANLSQEVSDNLIYTGIELHSGDVLFFDGYTPHRSAINQDDSNRGALFLFYYPTDCGEHYQNAKAFFNLKN